MGPKTWALVTGASSGIGLEFARALAADGRDVIVAARRIDELERIAEELRQRHGVQAVALRADLSEDDGAAKLVAAAESVGPIEVLINNAGFTLEGRYVEREWSAQKGFLNTMLAAPSELVWRLVPSMLERKSGTVINVSSLGAFYPSSPTYSLYAATKSFLLKFTRTLAEEYRGTGVTFTAVCPGFTRTAFIEDDTLAGENLRAVPSWLIAEPSRVAQRSLAAARSGKGVVYASNPDRAVAALLRHAPQELTSRVVGAWTTRSYDTWIRAHR
ncbi:SDR family NAD(P)-dependent oxidoreductase [Mycobacterium sp. C31M]